MAYHQVQMKFNVQSGKARISLQYLDSRDVIQSGLGLKTEEWAMRLPVVVGRTINSRGMGVSCQYDDFVVCRKESMFARMSPVSS